MERWPESQSVSCEEIAAVDESVRVAVMEHEQVIERDDEL
jgi:hypothetical protein